MLAMYNRHRSQPTPAAVGETAVTASPPNSPREVQLAKHWLHRASNSRLPEELLTLILYYGDYDCIHFVARAKHTDVRRSYGIETKAAPYVQTPPLKWLQQDELHPEWMGRVRRVTLTAKGKDQGWVNNRDKGSWSWFDVGKTKREHVAALEGGGDQVRRGPCWARNPVAGKEWVVHERVFDMDEVGEKDTEMREWIKSLENGHRVSIVPMACYGGWKCEVSEASIDVEVEIWR